MLVLKRKIGETIMIGDHVEVQVLDVDGDSVKLGFTAPKQIQILRKELHDGIANENVQANQLPAPNQSQLSALLKQVTNSSK